MEHAALLLGIAGLGGTGAVLRFALDRIVQRRVGGHFPAGTLAVNLSGSVVVGVLVGADLAGDAFLLAGTACLGSFTTFSTWIFEAHRLAEEGELRSGSLNLGGSLAAGLAAAALGRALGGLL